MKRKIGLLLTTALLIINSFQAANAETKECRKVRDSIFQDEKTVAILAKKADFFYKKAYDNNTEANLKGYFNNYSAYAESGRLIYTFADSKSKCFSPSKRAFIKVEEKIWWEKINFINDFSINYDAAFYSMRQRGQKSGYYNIYKKIYS